MVIVPVAMSLSFVIAALLNTRPDELYTCFRNSLGRLERDKHLADDSPLDIGDAKVAVIGMGRIGLSAYDLLLRHYGNKVIGIDIDPVTARNHQTMQRNVLRGDPSDPDFWLRVKSGSGRG